MQVFDLHHDISVSQALDSAAITSNTTTYSEWIDTASFESLTFIFSSATITDGSYQLVMQEADASDQSDAAAVASDLVLGAFSYAATDDNVAKRSGYIGKKRYVRAGLTSTGVTSGGTFSAVSVLGTPNHSPVADD